MKIVNRRMATPRYVYSREKEIFFTGFIPGLVLGSMLGATVVLMVGAL